MKEPVATLSFNGKSFDLTQRQLADIADGVMKNADRSYAIDFNKILSPLAETLEAMANYIPPVEAFEFNAAIRTTLFPVSFDGYGHFNLFEISDLHSTLVTIDSIAVSSAAVAGKHYNEHACSSTASCQFVASLDHQEELVLNMQIDDNVVRGKYNKETGLFVFDSPRHQQVELTMLVSYTHK